MIKKSPATAVLALGLMIAALAPALPGSTHEELRKDALEFFSPPLPERVELPPDNPSSPEKVALGRQLFADPRLGDDGKTACNSCHNLERGGADARPAVTGHSWQRAPRNAPSIYNALINTVVPLDEPGGDRMAPLVPKIRAGIDLERFPAANVGRLEPDTQLKSKFAAAFGGDAKISTRTIAFALEAYLATLVTPSPFDRFLAGDLAALGDLEKIGLASFIDKGCVSCHGGTNLGGTTYESFGAGEIPATGKGARAPVNKRSSPLRNVALTAPYFHTGSEKTLEGAVAQMLKMQTSDGSLDGDVATITAFLKTLSGTPPRLP